MATATTTCDDDKPDMTPMIDVVFLMIVFFVCIEFKTFESKLDAFLPSDRGSQPAVATPIEQLHVRVHVVAPGTAMRWGRPALAAAAPLDPATGRPARYSLVGHRVRWVIGPKPCADFAAAQRELQRLADDPALRILDAKTGQHKRMACVVEGRDGTRYDDIARTADLCRAAGFDDIHFGGD